MFVQSATPKNTVCERSMTNNKTDREVQKCLSVVKIGLLLFSVLHSFTVHWMNVNTCGLFICSCSYRWIIISRIFFLSLPSSSSSSFFVSQLIWKIMLFIPCNRFWGFAFNQAHIHRQYSVQAAGQWNIGSVVTNENIQKRITFKLLSDPPAGEGIK